MELTSRYIFLICLLLTIMPSLSEGKRSLSGRSRTSSSISNSRGSTRRTSTQTHYSPPPVNKPSSTVHHAPNADHVKLTYGGLNSQPNKPGVASQPMQNKPAPSYGWNVPQSQQPIINKPSLNAGPPPAYSPHNVPDGAKTKFYEPPPAYKSNNAASSAYPSSNQPSSGVSYPKQTYNSQNSGSGNSRDTGRGTGTYPVNHNIGFRTHNGTGGYNTGIHSPIYAQTVRPVAMGATYQPSGSIQPGFYPHQGSASHSYHQLSAGFPARVQPVGIPSGGFYPQQATPVFAGNGVQPGFYPAGTFPVKSSSGPGFGTGLLAGALGGAILGHALTPTHTHQFLAGGASHTPSDNQDRIIVINNNPGQPATVTSAGGQPVNGVNIIQTGEQPVPLASFPTQQQTQSGQSVPQSTAFEAGVTGASSTQFYEGVTPLPFLNINTTGKPKEDAAYGNGTIPQQYGVYCLPVIVNVTDPNNTANVTTVEQVYCFNVPETEHTAPVTNPSQQLNTYQSNFGNYSSNPLSDNNYPTQKTSTAKLANNSNIKSGSKGLLLNTRLFDITLMTAIAFYCIH